MFVALCDVAGRLRKLGEQRQELMNMLATLPDRRTDQLNTLRERRKQNAEERRSIQKDLKNEARKQKRVYAQASKCTIEELIGLAAAKAAKASSATGSGS